MEEELVFLLSDEDEEPEGGPFVMDPEILEWMRCREVSVAFLKAIEDDKDW